MFSGSRKWQWWLCGCSSRAVGEGRRQLERESHHCSSVPEGIQWINLCAWVVSNDRCPTPRLESSISWLTVSQMWKASPHRTTWPTVRAHHGALHQSQCYFCRQIVFAVPPEVYFGVVPCPTLMILYFMQSLKLCSLLRSNLIHNQTSVFCHSTADDAHIWTCAVRAYWASVFQPHCLSVTCVVLATWKLRSDF